MGSRAMLLKVKQVAQRLNLSVAKTYELLNEGAIPYFRIGGSLRVSEEALSVYLESCKSEVAASRQKPRRPRLKFMRV